MNKEDAKELAVYDRRYWLKITDSCNNNCIFCLDANSRKRNNFHDKEELFNKIEMAHTDGFTRLIISGGEASIHPDFLSLVSYARKLGFEKIQTITNGRMFSYQKFSRAAVGLGLSEVTFSIHGHTPELHDKLTGAKGSFKQAYQGIQNLLATKKCIVNIDIVINKLNLPYVEEVIRLFSNLGVYEYDLLHVVPFGSAFENKEMLFFNRDEAQGYLERIFSYHKDPRYYIWTNRFPPQYLENNEELIQDPHKLYDEILGRSEMFERYYETRNFDCYPDHCDFCFVKDICRKFLFHLQPPARHDNDFSVRTGIVSEGLFDLIETRDKFISLIVDYSRDNWDLLQRNQEKLTKFDNIRFICPDKSSWEEIIRAKSKWDIPALIYLKTLPEDFLTDRNPLPGHKLILPLTKKTSHLTGKKDAYSGSASAELSFQIPGYEKLSEAKKEQGNLVSDIQSLEGFPLENCPPCLNSRGVFRQENVLNIDLLRNDGTIDLRELVRDYIINDYFVKSFRCVKCAKNTGCKGLHINLIRVHGFKLMKPIQ